MPQINDWMSKGRKKKNTEKTIAKETNELEQS
jgi:hypothetical protein